MKVLHIIEPSGMGGVEKIVSDLLKISSCEIEIFIAMPDKYLSEFKDLFNIDKSLNLINMNFDGNKKFGFKRLLEYKRVFKFVNPDIIHTHSRKVCIFTSLLKGSINHIRTQHMEDSNINIIDKVLLKKKVDLWIATSNRLKNEYLLKNYGKNISCKYIYNGIKLSNVKSEYTKKNVKQIGFIGRLNKQKGLDLFIPILSKIENKNFILNIIGEGEEEKTLKSMVYEYGLQQNIIFHGKKKNVYNELIKLDCLVLPSRNEGLPLIILESMACGVPVVSNNVGAIDEVIIHNKNGFLINNDHEWINILSDILDDKIDISMIKKNSIETIKLKFNLENMCNEYYETYKLM